MDRHTAAAEAGTRLGGAIVTDHTNNNNSDANMMIGTISGGSSASSINSESSRSMMYGAAIRPAPLSYWSGYDGQMLAGFSWPPPSYTCNFCRREFRSAQALGGHMNVHRRDRARLRDSSPPPSSPSRCVAAAAADHHAPTIPPTTFQMSHDPPEEQPQVTVPKPSIPGSNPNPRKTRRPNPSLDQLSGCTASSALPNLNDPPVHSSTIFRPSPPEHTSCTYQQRTCNTILPLKLCPFTPNYQSHNPIKAPSFFSYPGHAEKKTDSSTSKLLSDDDEEMPYYNRSADDGSNTKCSSNKRSKAPARRKGVMRLELEIGIRGVDLQEDLDLELRLGYSSQLHHL